MISSPPGPSGRPFMTHLLPGGGVPRVHGARSPVPPRLLHFATPRSVHDLAAVAAGAYPTRHPADAWSPGAPAPPGPCYWLVAIGTPVGWRGDCLALGLVRGAVRHYCLGGCSALVMCARRSRLIRGAWTGARCGVFPVSPFPPHVSRTVCGGRSRPGVPYPRLLVRHSMRSVRSAGSVRLPFWYSPRVLCVCMRLRCRGVCAPPSSPDWSGAHLARSRCCTQVGPFHAVHAPERVLPRSRAPFGLLGGGGGPVSPLPGLGLYAPRGVGLRVWGVPAPGAGGGGGLCAVLPDGVAGEASGAGGRLASVHPSAFPGQATRRGCSWLRSCHGGRGLHTAPVRARLLSPGAVRVAPWCVGAGSLVQRGSCGNKRLGRGGRPCSGLPPGRRGPAGGRGDRPLCLGGVGGRRPRGSRVSGGVGGTGGGSPGGSPPPPSGGGGMWPSAPSPPRCRRIPPRCTRSVGVVGQPRAPAAACRRRTSLAGGGGGQPVSRPPGGVAGGPGGRRVALPRSVPLPSVGGQQCRRHWRRSGHGGRGPHTAAFCCRVPPPGVVCASFLCAGAGSPACRVPGVRGW